MCEGENWIVPLCEGENCYIRLTSLLDEANDLYIRLWEILTYWASLLSLIYRQ